MRESDWVAVRGYLSIFGQMTVDYRAPNQVSAADVTYVWTTQGWLYLAVVLELFNREVVGWSIKPRMTADIVIDALTMAWFRRRPTPGLIHHCDRGSPGNSRPRSSPSASWPGAASSRWTGGTWRDNVFAERLWRSVKYERVYLKPYDSVSAARLDIADYLDWYNMHRGSLKSRAVHAERKVPGGATTLGTARIT
jgi:putative transposase